MAEAGFLRRRQERLDERTRNQQEKALATTNDLNENNDLLFVDVNEWFHEPWEAWKVSVALLPTTIPQTESDKRRVRMQIVHLQQELHGLRTKVLLSTGNTLTTSRSRTSSQHPAASPSNRGNQEDVLLEQFYKQLTESQSLLEDTKKCLLPKGKFVFARYRLAMQQQQQNLDKERRVGEEGGTMSTDTGLDYNDTNNCVSTSSSTKEPGVYHDQLQCYQHATIHILPDSIQVTPRSSNETTNYFPNEASTTHTDRLPVVLSRLKNCHVTYDASVDALSNIHIVDCTHITVSFPRAAALHVTNCHHVTFSRATIQQVRLHDSSWLSCDCIITAGAILEGCHSVLFGHPCQVRDFHWLKTGIPSPNFSFTEDSSTSIAASTPPTTSLRQTADAQNTAVPVHSHGPKEDAVELHPSEHMITGNFNAAPGLNCDEEEDSDDEL